MRKHSRPIQVGNDGEPVTKKRLLESAPSEAWLSESEWCADDEVTQKITITSSEYKLLENNVFVEEETKVESRPESYGEHLSEDPCTVTDCSAVFAPFQNKEISEITLDGQANFEELTSISDANKAASPNYILSSGRQGQKDSDKRVPNIDDEFEKYFAELMI
ncbi:hypothetical protein O6H91_18G076100 [Diphasiastrum complanatum]|uniref:Uncharacterized protein n=1 Tax=Diphasiastrum complanatum TaxID=34168 RepID=A0ACC2B2P6_DIPCM|nr:hypothetical protein O6H91_18G076100 [Diphasiastrum complanatum]